MSDQPLTPFRFTPEQRAAIRRGFDVDALERLLGMCDAGERERYLKGFSRTEIATPGIFLIEIGDPEKQAALDEVYAPRWEHMSDEDLLAASADPERIAGELPGRRTVMRRRRLLG